MTDMQLLPDIEMMTIFARGTLRMPPIVAAKEFLKAVWFACEADTPTRVCCVDRR
jgi:hypothetical protein